MNSSKSSPKQGDKNSSNLVLKPVSPFQLFYQLTFMSAMAASGISRSKIFEIAASSKSNAAIYFAAINTLVNEMRYEYPEACRAIGAKAKSDNMRTFLLRLSDALRAGEPLAEFLAREAEVQGQDYESRYERDLEGLKQWSNAFSSMLISVALIVIIQMVSSMIYSMDVSMMTGLVATAFLLSCLGAWIIQRSAPREIMTVSPSVGSMEQKRAARLMRLLIPISLMAATLLNLIGVPLGILMLIIGTILIPIGIAGMASDKKTIKKDVEFSTFLRSIGGMATSSGTTLKQALTKVDLSSFPTLEPDITRLSTRLQALVDPELCWHRFGLESGSMLVSEVADIFYGAIKIGGDPERVGYLCSLFSAKTTQLRAKRRLVSGTFSGLTLVIQGVVAALMVFVLSIVTSFAEMVRELIPKNTGAMQGQSISLGMAEFSPSDLQFLSTMTIIMILAIAAVSAGAIIICNGGFKLKFFFFLAVGIFIAGIAFILVPPMVAGILKT